MATPSASKRKTSISVAISFGDEDALQRLGSGVAKLSCPACGAVGVRFGNPGEDLRFEGFTPLTAGGILAIFVRCDHCQARVSLPHRPIRAPG